MVAHVARPSGYFLIMPTRREEQVELVEKTCNLSLEPIDNWEKQEDVMVNKLQTKEGSLPCPNTLHSDWTYDFPDFLNFRYMHAKCHT